MATEADVTAARKRVESLRQKVREENRSKQKAVDSASNDITLKRLQDEEKRLEAELRQRQSAQPPPKPGNTSPPANTKTEE